MEATSQMTPAKRPRRDQQARRQLAKLVKLSGLDDVRYRPALANLARITLLLQRSYETLRQRESLLNEDGELCSSIDVVRRLAGTQADLLKQLGLMPTSVLPDDRAGSLDAVFERISKVRKVREGASGEQSSAA
jgi:hypothetical protein